jgi:hypothetical protein
VAKEDRVQEPVLSSEDEDRFGAPTADEEDDDIIRVDTSQGSSVYLRGAAKLPKLGLPVEQRLCIAPYGEW